MKKHGEGTGNLLHSIRGRCRSVWKPKGAERGTAIKRGQGRRNETKDRARRWRRLQAVIAAGRWWKGQGNNVCSWWLLLLLLLLFSSPITSPLCGSLTQQKHSQSVLLSLSSTPRTRSQTWIRKKLRQKKWTQNEKKQQQQRRVSEKRRRPQQKNLRKWSQKARRIEL